MASERKSGVRVVKDGERHIYPTLEKTKIDIKIQDEPYKTREIPHRTQASMPTILVNTEVQSIAKLKLDAKKYTQRKNSAQEKKGKRKSKLNPEPCLPESAAGTYGAPEIHSTLRVGEALIRAREEEPDLSQLVQKKLDSPKTASRFKKQVSKQVNVPESQPVFQELVSLDVSEGALASQLMDLLNLRAEAVMPVSQSPDPEPCPSDIVDPEEYVSCAPATTAPAYLPFTTITPQTLHTHEFSAHRDYILGLNFNP